MGLSLAAFALYALAQVTLFVAGLFYAPLLAGGPARAFSNPIQDGLLGSVTTCLSAPVLIGLTCLFARLRRGPALKNYFALQWPRAREAARAVIYFLLFMAVTDTLMMTLERPIVPELMAEAYQSVSFTPVFWLAVIVVAPVTDELFYRGFVFTGIQQSKAGPLGATLLTGACWTIIRWRYDIDLLGMTTIFAGGLMLGWVRMRTDSLPLCVILHAFMNLAATLKLLELARYTNG